MLLLLGQLHRKSYKWGVGTASTTSEIGYIEHQEACNQTSFLQWIYRYTAFKDRAFKEAHARPKIYPYECVKTSSGTHTHCCIHMHMHMIYSALVHYLLIWMPVLVCNSPSFVCVCVSSISTGSFNRENRCQAGPQKIHKHWQLHPKPPPLLALRLVNSAWQLQPITKRLKCNMSLAKQNTYRAAYAKPEDRASETRLHLGAMQTFQWNDILWKSI